MTKRGGIPVNAAAEWVDVTSLVPWDRNPVIHTAAEIEELRALVASSVWTDPLVARRSDRRIIAGHRRRLAALEALRLDPSWTLPDAPGVGLVPVRFVEVDDATAARLTIADNAMTKQSAWDDSVLVEMLREMDDPAGLGFDDEALAAMLASSDDPGLSEVYTRKISPPVYEPCSTCPPPVSSLCDTRKSEDLLAEIRQACLPTEIQTFLEAAAARHVRFNFRAIAEFYAHADASTQRLMERSALVVIDFGDAIANGFVRMTKHLGEIADDEGSTDA